MSRPSMQQDWHPDHNMPAPEHDGTTLMPDFSGKISDTSTSEEDQRSMDNKYRNLMDIQGAKY